MVVQVAEGVSWHIDSGEVAIPRAGELTDVEIGAAVRRLLPLVPICHRLGCEGHPDASREFASVDEAVAYAEQCRRREQERAALRETAAARRVESKGQRDRLFVQVGRRDGFACRRCGSPASDLQLDHAVPLIDGGTNELANLQLLCAACHRAKSEAEAQARREQG